MTCPIDELPEFDRSHWDVYELCSLMRCRKCAAEDGEGVFFGSEGPPERGHDDAGGVCDGGEIQF